MGKYSTPRVPLQTPMFDSNGLLTRTWIIFFERLKYAEIGETGAPGAPGTAAGLLLQRTLLLKDTTAGLDVADHVTVYAAGTATRLVGVLRRSISAHLTVMVKRNGINFCTLTIPMSTLVDHAVETTTFMGSTAMVDGDVLSWDVTESDGGKDRAGIASFTLEWSGSGA